MPEGIKQYDRRNLTEKLFQCWGSLAVTALIPDSFKFSLIEAFLQLCKSLYLKESKRNKW